MQVLVAHIQDTTKNMKHNSCFEITYLEQGALFCFHQNHNFELICSTLF